MILLIIAFIVVFGILVFVHEFGHFIVAKKNGVQVDEFGFGFPPKIWGKKVGETEYTLNLLPLGGFVRLHGEGGEDAKNPKSYSHLGAGKRSMILLAGVVMNFLLAVFIFIILNLTGIPSGAFEEPVVEPGATVVEASRIIVASVEKDSPAAKAGIKESDELIAGNGVPFQTAKSISEFTRVNASREVEFTIKRDGAEQKIKVSLRSADDGKAPLGVQPVSVMRVKYPFLVSIYKGIKDVALIFWGILVGLGNLVIGLVTVKKGAADGVSGPIGIGVLLNQYIKLGLPYVLYFAGILSVTLAVFNVLPIPALDGGRFFFVVIEKIRGKKMTAKVENTIHTVGFVLLLLMVILVSIRDIGRFF